MKYFSIQFCSRYTFRKCTVNFKHYLIKFLTYIFHVTIMRHDCTTQVKRVNKLINNNQKLK